MVMIQLERNEMGLLLCSADLNDSDLAFGKPAYEL